ncbi:TPA: hypothetical protein ACKQDX_002143 [Serratia marcescens]
MTLTTEQLRARAKFWREKAVEAKWESVSIAQDMLLNADAFDKLAANREAQPVGFRYRHKDTVSWLYNDWRWPDSVEAEQCQIEWLYTAPPAPANANAVAWEMRYWNSGHYMWHDWERITAEQHAEMSVQHAADSDYEFRVLYDAPPAPAAPEAIITAPIDAMRCGPAASYVLGWNACRAAMLAQPVSSGYKLPPHVYRELVNSLRDTAVKFSGTEQLRERLNTALSQFIEPDHPHTRTVAPEGGNDHDTRR